MCLHVYDPHTKYISHTLAQCAIAYSFLRAAAAATSTQKNHLAGFRMRMILIEYCAIYPSAAQLRFPTTPKKHAHTQTNTQTKTPQTREKLHVETA